MSVPSIRRLALLAVGAIGLGWVAVAVAAVTGAVPWLSALILAGVLACLAVLPVVGAAVLVVNRRLTTALARQTQLHADVVAVLRSTHAESMAVRAEADRRHEDHFGELARALADLGASSSRLQESAVDVAADVAAARRDTAQAYWQIEALLDLRALLKPRAPLPALRNWAASPDVIHWLVEHVLARRPSLIVECGSGASSLWLGYAVQLAGTGRVIALEHDGDYAAVSAQRVRDHGLDDVVEVRHAPLESWRQDDDEQEWLWYSLDAVKDLKGIELLFVDGPPAKLGPTARYPAFPVLLPHCADDVTIVLDDAFRPDERAVSSRWLDENPEFEVTGVRNEKGMFFYQRRATGSAD